ncbi:MAG: NUDIX hydrolase, partial [Mycobacteriales bacterium]
MRRFPLRRKGFSVTDPAYDVVSSTVHFTGRVITLRTDDVRMPDGAVVKRDVIAHPGAVGVVALDDSDRIMLIRQYRPAVRCYLWELPAGLLDAPGEDPLAAAARELAEEVGIRAGEWSVLVDVHSSPGMSNEIYRVYLARALSEKPDDFVAGPDEEADMQEQWLPLAEAVARILSGDITNGLAVAGILSASAWRASGAPLRAADAPWPARSVLG